MGNCQATDIAAITVEYPGGRVEKLFLTIPAQELMTKYPGHFVAITAVAQQASATEQLKPVFKLLPADAPLRVGNRYRLVSFEEVFTYFSQGGSDARCSTPRKLPESVPLRGRSQMKRPAKEQQMRPGVAPGLSSSKSAV